MQKGLFLRLISIAILIAFFWTNCVCAGGVFVSVEKSHLDKLSGTSQTAGVGDMLLKHTDSGKLLLGQELMNRLGINSLSDVIANMQILDEEGIKCLVSSDNEGKKARYTLEGGGILRRIKRGGRIEDRFYRILELLGKESIEEGVDDYVYEWIYVTDKNVKFINSILQNLSGNDPNWVVKPTRIKEGSGLTHQIEGYKVTPESTFRMKQIYTSILRITKGLKGFKGKKDYFGHTAIVSVIPKWDRKEDFIAKVRAVQEVLAKELDGVIGEGRIAWIGEDSWHITISDLNKDIVMKKLPQEMVDVAPEIREVLNSVGSFDLEFKEITIAPNGAIWINGYVHSPVISQLRDRLLERFQPRFPNMSRPIMLQLVIGRIRGTVDIDGIHEAVELIERREDQEVGVLRVDRIFYVDETGPFTSSAFRDLELLPGDVDVGATETAVIKSWKEYITKGAVRTLYLDREGEPRFYPFIEIPSIHNEDMVATVSIGLDNKIVFSDVGEIGPNSNILPVNTQIEEIRNKEGEVIKDLAGFSGECTIFWKDSEGQLQQIQGVAYMVEEKRVGNCSVQFNGHRGSRTGALVSRLVPHRQYCPFCANLSNGTMVKEMLTGVPVKAGERPCAFFLNSNPFNKDGHFLVLPYKNNTEWQKRDQRLEEEDIMNLTLLAKQFNDFCFFFNGLGAAAGVNHIHYQAVFNPVKLPIEELPVKGLFKIGGVSLSKVSLYPGCAFVFEGSDDEECMQVVWKAVDFFQDRDIPINLVFSHGKVYLMPRKAETAPDIFPGVKFGGMEVMMKFIITKSKNYNSVRPLDLDRALKEVLFSDRDNIVADFLEYIDPSEMIPVYKGATKVPKVIKDISVRIDKGKIDFIGNTSSWSEIGLDSEDLRILRDSLISLCKKLGQCGAIEFSLEIGDFSPQGLYTDANVVRINWIDLRIPDIGKDNRRLFLEGIFYQRLYMLQKGSRDLRTVMQTFYDYNPLIRKATERVLAVDRVNLVRQYEEWINQIFPSKISKGDVINGSPLHLYELSEYFCVDFFDKNIQYVCYHILKKILDCEKLSILDNLIAKLVDVLHILLTRPDLDSLEIMQRCDLSREQLLDIYKYIRILPILRRLIIEYSKYPEFARETSKMLENVGYIEDLLHERVVYPLILELQLGPRCDSDCVHCFGRGVEYVEKKWQEGLIDEESVLKMVREAAQNGVRNIWFSGGKEPLVSPITIKAMGEAQRLGLTTRLYTNGIALSSDEHMKIVLNCDQVRVSINGATPGVYAKVHYPDARDPAGGSKIYERVLGHVRRLVELKKDNKGRAKVAMSFIVIPENHHEIKAIVDLAYRLGVDSIQIRSESVGTVRNFNELEINYILLQVAEILDEQRKGNYGNMEIQMRGLTREELKADKKVSQFMPGLRKAGECRAGILKRGFNPYGYVSHCEFASHPQHAGMYSYLRLGNIKNESLGEILERNAGKTPPLCHVCQAHEYGMNIILEKLARDLENGFSITDQPLYQSSEKRFGVGTVMLVGMGRWGEGRLLPALMESVPDIRVVAIARSNYIKMKNKYEGNGRVFVYPSEQYEILLRDPGIKAVVVGTDAVSHYEIVKRALECGKDVFVEKPITATKKEADELEELARKKNCKLVVGYRFMFDSDLQRLYNFLVGGRLGKIRRVDLRMLNPLKGRKLDLSSNVVEDLVVHLLSQIQLLFGQKDVSQLEVSGIVDEMAEIEFLYGNIPVSIAVDRKYDRDKDREFDRVVRLEGEYGVVELDYFKHIFKYYDSRGVFIPQDDNRFPGELRQPSAGHDAVVDELKSFLKAVVTRGSSISDADKTNWIVGIIEKINGQITQQKEVEKIYTGIINASREKKGFVPGIATGGHAAVVVVLPYLSGRGDVKSFLERVRTFQEELSKTFADTIPLDSVQWMGTQNLHLTIADMNKGADWKEGVSSEFVELDPEIEGIIADVSSEVEFRGITIAPNGAIWINGYPRDDKISNLRRTLRENYDGKISGNKVNVSDIFHLLIGRVVKPLNEVQWGSLIKKIENFMGEDFGRLYIDRLYYADEINPFSKPNFVLFSSSSCKKNPAQTQYSRIIEDYNELPVLCMEVNYLGEVLEVVTKGNLDKLARVLDIEDVASVPGAVKWKMQGILNSIKKNPKYGIGIFGAVKRIVVVDNLGGLDSIVKDGKGAVAVLQDGTVLIDIDVFRNDMVLTDVVLHELWESILELVESNPAVSEATAIYQNLKDFVSMTEEEQTLLVAFLNQSDNGLASQGYGELLRYIAGNKVSPDELIVLAISYVMREPRYSYLGERLKMVLAGDVRKAEEKMNLAKDIYSDVAKAVTEWEPIIQKVKIAELKSKALMKAKMVVSSLLVEQIGLVDELVERGKYVKLDVVELKSKTHIVDWLKRLLENKNFTEGRKSPFVLYFSNPEYTVDAFLKEFNLDRDKFSSEDILQGLKRTDVITILDLGRITDSEMDPEIGLYLPLFYSVSNIYLASRVVLVSGDLKDLKDGDNLTYTTLMAIYKAVFGDEFTDEWLSNMFIGKLPPIIVITEALNTFRMAVIELEQST